ncbi:MAG: hypothetical protein JSS34_01015 [Proteobacteria bacterium]|nr:hypothetical protein [Pseudomonadota bacterium]
MKYTKIRAFTLSFLAFGAPLSSAPLKDFHAGREDRADFTILVSLEPLVLGEAFVNPAQPYMIFDRKNQRVEGNDIQTFVKGFDKLLPSEKENLKINVYYDQVLSPELSQGVIRRPSINDFSVMTGDDFVKKYQKLDGENRDRKPMRIRFVCSEPIFTKILGIIKVDSDAFDRIIWQGGLLYGMNHAGEFLYTQDGKQVASYNPTNDHISIYGADFAREFLKRANPETFVAWKKSVRSEEQKMMPHKNEEDKNFKETPIKARDLLKMMEEKPELSFDISFQRSEISASKMKEALTAYKAKKRL